MVLFFCWSCSGSRKVIIVEKTPNRYASYHGDVHRFLDNEDATDVDALELGGSTVTKNGDLPESVKNGSSGAQNGLDADGFIHRNKAMKRANRVMM